MILGLFFWGSVIVIMCYFSPASRWNLVPQICVMNASVFIHIVFLFQSEGNYAFVNIQWDTVRWNKFQLLHACLRGKSSTFWKLHLPQKNSPRIKNSFIHTWWTCWQITWIRIFISNTAKINDIQSRMSLK